MRKKKFDEELLMQKLTEYSKNRSTKLRNEIVEMNLGLVNLVVRQNFRDIGIEDKELISLGYFGLINAVEKYDINYGTKFSCFARKCILYHIASRIYKVINTGAENYVYAMLRYKKKLEKSSDLILEDNVSSLDELLNEDDQTDDRMKSWLRDYLMTRCLEFSDENVGSYEMEEDIIDRIAYNKQLRAAIDKLSPKQRKIIELYYGFNGNEHTYKEIAKQFGVSRQYIEAENKRILTKLRRKVK